METPNKRDYGYDNIKFILIFCVVFGHFLEFCKSDAGNYIYRLIYLFHMPVFIFISGYFARFNKKKIAFDLFAVYLIFQFLYVIFQRTVLHTEADMRFTYPYWIMWYMLAVTFYNTLIPLYEAETTKKQILALFSVFIIALAAGYEKSIGYPMTLSRFFVFQPYFLMGYYYKTKEDYFKNWFSKDSPQKKATACVLLVVLTAAVSYFAATSPALTSKLYYGSYAYTQTTDIFIRGGLYVVSLCWIMVLVFLVKPLASHKIPIITTIGKNSLSVYLLHGFIMKLGENKIIEFSNSILMVLLYTAVILLILGNSFTLKLLNILFPWRWGVLTENKKLKMLL